MASESLLQLAGKPLATLRRELAAEVVELTTLLSAGEYGEDAHRDGQRLALMADSVILTGQDTHVDAAERLAMHIAATDFAEGIPQGGYLGIGVQGILFLAGGLAVQSQCTGSGESLHWQRAREFALRSLALADRPDYIGTRQRGNPTTDGARCLGDWAQILTVCTCLLRQRDDRQLKIAAARAVAAIINCHYHPDIGLLLELTSREFYPFADDRATYVHSGAALAGLVGLLVEAQRGSEEKLLKLSGRYLRQHLEAAWDPVDGGLRDEYKRGRWSAAKSAEVQALALQALSVLLACECGGWQVEWFNRVYMHRVYCERSESLGRLHAALGCAANLAAMEGI